MNLAHLRQLAELLPPGASVSLPREALLEAIADGAVPPAEAALVADLSVEQLATLFGKRPSTVRAWLEAGACPQAYKLNGKTWRVPRDAALAMQARLREAPVRQRERVRKDPAASASAGSLRGTVQRERQRKAAS